MKRILSLFLILITLCSFAALYITPAAAEETELQTPSMDNVDGALVYNFENNKTIFKHNSTEKLYPTSTVKIMTGILAVEHLGDRMNEQITVTEQMLADVVGNNIGLKAGEAVTIGDIVWTLLVNGANDSAYVVAYTVAGSAEKFVSMMNTRAKELGAYNTNYLNPTGMHDDNMYTTVEDTAIIAKHAYTLPLFMEATSSVKYTLPATNVYNKDRTFYNRNCLLTVYYDKNYYDPQARGMNAGSTPQGGNSVVTTSTNGDLTYLVIAMGGKTVDETVCAYTTVSALIDWAFEAYTYTEVLSPDQIICEIPVTLSTATDFVNCVAIDTLNVYLPSNVNVEEAITLSYVTYSEELQAPVEQGQIVGSVTAMYGEEILGTSNMIATADVTRSELLHTFYQIEQFSHSRFFIATVISAVVFTVIYIFGTAFIRGRKNGRRNRY